jgi:hypothetical protein
VSELYISLCVEVHRISVCNSTQLISSLKEIPSLRTPPVLAFSISSSLPFLRILFIFSQVSPSLSPRDCLLPSLISLSFIRSYIDLRPVIPPSSRSRLHSNFILHCPLSQRALSFYADKENV